MNNSEFKLGMICATIVFCTTMYTTKITQNNLKIAQMKCETVLKAEKILLEQFSIKTVKFTEDELNFLKTLAK